MTRLLTLDEVAEQLSVSRSSVSRFIRSGELRSIQLGSNRRVAEEDLRKFVPQMLITT